MPNARTTDPTTSHDAASSAYEPTEVQAHILEVLRSDMHEWMIGGVTDDELYGLYVLFARENNWVIPTPQSVRSRRSELARDGQVAFTGIFGLTASGRRTQKWRAI